MLEELSQLFAQRFQEKYQIVEPAHMELAEPSIATAYANCAKRGATRIVVCPFFLGPGKHWTFDIPRLDRKSTRLNSSHSQISYAVFCLKKKKKQNTDVNNIDNKHVT